MKDNFDLTLLLRGHEGEKFWSPAFGEMEFLEIHDRAGGRPLLKFKTFSGNCRNFTPRGCIGYEYEGPLGGECIVWPSKECQSWESWKGPLRLCGGCRKYTPIGGDCGVCPWSENHVLKDSPGCPHHKLSADILLPLIAERIRGREKDMEDLLRLVKREM